MKERDRWEKFIIHWDIQDDGDDVVDDDDDAKQLNLSESLPSCCDAAVVVWSTLQTLEHTNAVLLSAVLINR